jgi:hypothetical protein
MNEQISKWQVKSPDQLASKMTKRETIASMAMQGHIECQQPGYEGEASFIARLSVEHADALLKALEGTK